jgi:hypothetical protein
MALRFQTIPIGNVVSDLQPMFETVRVNHYPGLNPLSTGRQPRWRAPSWSSFHLVSGLSYTGLKILQVAIATFMGASLDICFSLCLVDSK